MHRTRRRTSLCLMFLAVLCLGGDAGARTTAPSLDPDLLVDRWTTEDGLPLDHITDLAIADDGFLWLATLDGLARFDGSKFHSFRKGEHPELPSNRFVALETGPRGTVWAVCESGQLVRYDGLHFEVYAPPQGMALRYEQLVQTGGAIYAVGTGGLARLEQDGPVPVPGIGPDERSWTVLADGKGLWIGTSRAGLMHLEAGGAAVPVSGAAGLHQVQAIASHPEGGLWLGSSDGLHRYRDGELQAVETVDGRAVGQVCQVAADASPWLRTTEWVGRVVGDRVEIVEPFESPPCIGAGDGLAPADWRVAEGRLDHLDKPVLHLSTNIRAVEPRPDGTAWIATDGTGLLHLRQRTVLPADPRGLSLQTVFIDHQQRTWTGEFGGRITRLDPDGEWVAPPWREPARPTASIAAIAEGPQGRVWLAQPDGPCIVQGDRCTTVGLVTDPAQSQATRAMLATQDGRMWVGLTHGLFVGEATDQGWSWQPVLGPDGAPIQDVGALVEGPDGTLWAGTRGAGVLHLSDEGARQWTAADGLSSETIRALWISPAGDTWVGTEDAGLCRIAPSATERQVACIGRRDGLFDDAIHSIVADDQDRLWMSTNRGIFWVRLAALETFVAGHLPQVLSVGLTERDGMLDAEANGGAQPAAARDDRGRLIFPTQVGLAVVDPSTVEVPDPPPVHLEALRVGEREVSPRQSDLILLAPDERDIEVEWTAPEFHRPEQLRFRYRLVGFDEAWSGPTEQRSAVWTNLPPGYYQLELQAGLGGAWSPSGARVRLRRSPAFVETPWFLVSLGFGGLLIGGLVTSWRGRQQRRQQRKLQRLVGIRTAALADTNQALADSNEELEEHTEMLAAQTVALEDQAVQLRKQAETLGRQNAEIRVQAERLAEVDELRTRLVTDLSHELRTPLTLVAGPLEDLAASEVVPPGPDRDRLDVIRRNTRRLETLVDQLLDVARLESGKISLRVQHRDLGAFLRRVADRFRPECQRLGLELVVRTPDHPVGLYFDPDLLDKVLSNLLANAMKFTPREGRIQVLLRAADDDPGSEDEPARVEVQDSGIGIPEELGQRLFDRFHQGDRGDTRRFEGVGIGLALARDLVQLHGGDIGGYSQPDKGSTFWFELPRGVAHLSPDDLDLDAAGGESKSGLESLSDATLPMPPPPSSSHARVLVVEDHPDMRDFLVAHLQHHFDVTTAEDGAEALLQARAEPPAAIISDVMMPHMDGLELCRQLRQDPDLAAVPILLASAKASEVDRVAGLELADDYLAKPLRMRELVARVQKLVERSSSSGESRLADTLENGSPDDSLGQADRELLARLEAAIAQHMDESDFGVKELAKTMAYSRRQLLREVKRLTDHSPSDLLRVRRMEEGRRLLRVGAVRTVSEAAARVGLSLAYFSRTYSAWFGTAPSTELAAQRD